LAVPGLHSLIHQINHEPRLTMDPRSGQPPMAPGVSMGFRQTAPNTSRAQLPQLEGPGPGMGQNQRGRTVEAPPKIVNIDGPSFNVFFMNPGTYQLNYSGRRFPTFTVMEPGAPR
ncbi:hypothetical protein Ocin01_09358, partial [Orchesella cincta]